MVAFRNSGIAFLIILFTGFRFLLIPADAVAWYHVKLYPATESSQHSKFQNAESSSYVAVEVRDYSRSVSEYHRFLSLTILPNQIVPPNSVFGQTVLTTIPIEVHSLVPIFIRGCSLLN